MDEVSKTRPARIVFDSLSEFRLLAETPLRYRRELLNLKRHLAQSKSTVLLLDDKMDRSLIGIDPHVLSLSHGVIEMEQLSPDYGTSRRRLRVLKLRGIKFREGYHDYTIETGGLRVFPRLVAAEHYAKILRPVRVRSGIKHLDDLLGGGLDRGTMTPDLVVVAEAASGSIALEAFRRTAPDVVLMDGSMPEMNGIQATHALRQLQPRAKIIALTLYEASTYMEEMIAAGAKGYLSKISAPGVVADAIRAVAAGRTYFDEKMPRRSPAVAKRQPASAQLTSDEVAVLNRLVDGDTNAEIAAALDLTLPIVESHRAAAMKKLNVRSRAELARVLALHQS